MIRLKIYSIKILFLDKYLRKNNSNLFKLICQHFADFTLVPKEAIDPGVRG